MAQTNDYDRAREALAAPAEAVTDPLLLGAVRDGLLSVPADPAAESQDPAAADRSLLAVRRTPGR